MRKIPELKLSKKGNELVNFYKLMVDDGYQNDNFNPGRFKEFLKNSFDEYNIKTVLDYGSGRGNSNKKIYNDNTISAFDYFNLDKVYQFEPTISNSEKKIADCVMCFDVLEHIFISDLKNVITDIYNYSRKLVIIKVACYDAKAKLPNGENAHITVRNPMWWKGFLDSVSSEFEEISTLLICTTKDKKFLFFKPWSLEKWNQFPNYKSDF